MDNEGSYMGIEPDVNPGSYMAVDPHEKQFSASGSAGGRKKQPKKKASNPGSYMAVDPGKFAGDGNPGSYFEMTPDGDDGDSYMAVDPFTGQMVKKKRAPRHRETDVEFAAAKKAAAKAAANPGSYMAVDPGSEGNPGSYMAVDPAELDENSFVAVDPHSGRTGIKRRDPRTGEISWDFAAVGGQDKGNPGSYMAMEPDFELDEDMDMTQFLAKAAQQAKGDGNFQGMNDEWIEQQHDKLSKQPWYKGDIGRKDALTVLKGKQDGAFLVRASQSQPGTYACSLVDKGKVDHMLLLPSYAGAEAEAPGATYYRFGTKTKRLFNTVPKLIAYYIGHELDGTKLKLQGEVHAESQAGGFLASTAEEDNEGAYMEMQPDAVVEGDVQQFAQKASKASERDNEFKGDNIAWLEQQHAMLRSQPWFRQDMARKVANAALFRKADGAFVVRPSTSKVGHYAISFVKAGQVDHMLCLPSYAGNDPSVPGATRYRFGTKTTALFNTIPKLIAYYIGHKIPRVGIKLKGKVVRETQEGGFTSDI